MHSDTESQRVNPDWIPPAVPMAQIVERDGVFLCLNPKIPAWFGTTKAGSSLLTLIDGKRSVGDIHQLLANQGVALSGDQLVDFFTAAKREKFFDSIEDGDVCEPWVSRRLKDLYLHLTDRCNLQCSYCYRESSPHLPIRNRAERFCEMLEFIKPFTDTRMAVTFSGGEPLTYPGFEDVVRASSALGYSNTLLSNGTLITPKRAAFIQEHFRLVKISLDGPTDEIHAQTRGKGNFAKVVRGIKAVGETGVKVLVQVTLSKENLPHADNVHQIFEGYPDIKVRFTPMLPMGRGVDGTGDFIGADVFHSFSRKLVNTRGQGLSIQHVPGRRFRACHAGLANLSIADTGDVYPCHLFHQDRFLLGNIFDEPFEGVFYGERAKRFARSMDVESNNPTCKSCEVRFLCGGGCHANTLYATGDHRGPDSYCSYIKKSVYDDLFTLIGHPEKQRQGLPVVS